MYLAVELRLEISCPVMTRDRGDGLLKLHLHVGSSLVAANSHGLSLDGYHDCAHSIMSPDHQRCRGNRSLAARERRLIEQGTSHRHELLSEKSSILLISLAPAVWHTRNSTRRGRLGQGGRYKSRRVNIAEEWVPCTWVLC